MAFGVPTGLARTPGLRHQYFFNGLTLNRKGVPIFIPGSGGITVGEDDRYKITTVSGFEDADVRDSREVNAGVDGEQSLVGLAGGRTIVLEGTMETGSYKRLEDMKQAFRQAFDPLVDSELIIRDISNDVRDDFESNTIGNYNVFTGGGTVSVTGGQLVPSSTAKKVAVYDLGDPMADNQVILEYRTGASLGTTAAKIGVVLKWLDSTNYLYAYARHDGKLGLKRVDLGVESDLPGSGGTAQGPVFVANTTYYLLARIEGDVVYMENWGQAVPQPGLESVGYTWLNNRWTYTLTQAIKTKFGVGVVGRSGIWWTPQATTERVNSFSIENYANDLSVMCRKSSSLQGVDQQTDFYYRRPFQITLRAPSKDLNNRSSVGVYRAMNVVAPPFANETFSVGGVNPFAPGTGSFTDDSANMLVSTSSLAGARNIDGKLKITGQPTPEIYAYDDFSGTDGVSIVGQAADIGGNWQALSGAGTQTMAYGTAASTDVMVVTGTATGLRLAQLGTTSFAALRALMMLRVDSSMFGARYGFFVRYVDANNYVHITIGKGLTTWGVWVTERVGGGETAVIALSNYTSPTARRWLGVELAINNAGHIVATLSDFGNGDAAPLSTGTVFTNGYKFLNSYFSSTGGGATGKVGIYDSVTSSGAPPRVIRSFAVYEPNTALNGVARSFDSFSGLFKTITNGSHLLEFDVDTSMGVAWADGNGRLVIRARTMLKYLRSSQSYIAAELQIAVVNTPDWGIEYKLIIHKMVGTVRTALASSAEILIPGNFVDLGGGQGLFSDINNLGSNLGKHTLSASITGNVITANLETENGPSGTKPGLTMSINHTLVSGDATTYGSGVATGNYGWVIDQPADTLSSPRFSAVDTYQAIGAIVTPQTVEITNNGNYRALPRVTLGAFAGLGFAAGTIITATSADGVDRGQIVFQKAIADGTDGISWITYDCATGIVRDQLGNTRFGYVSDVSRDIELPPGQVTTLELQSPNWQQTNSYFAVDAASCWR